VGGSGVWQGDGEGEHECGKAAHAGASPVWGGWQDRAV
jgi:hypothetical protein